MREAEFSVSDIKELIKVFGASGLGKLKLSQGGASLEMERGEPASVAMMCPEATAETLEPEKTGNTVISPIVGTFYAAPSPDSKPFVTVGSQVKKGEVLCIIESMKLLNEITSEFDGTVAEILVENASPVEYGHPLMTIK